MHPTRPLPDTHPEFTVIRWPGFTEYRVESWRLARDGSGRVVRGTCAWSWVDAILVLAIAFLLQSSTVSRLAAIAFGLARVWAQCHQVLHESVLVFPIGVQLSTFRGHPLLPPLFATHHFVPRSALEDVVLHEGFRRWDVRFYMALLRRGQTGGVEVRVAFENILPYFPVLHVVYLGMQEALFPPPALVEESDGIRTT